MLTKTEKIVSSRFTSADLSNSITERIVELAQATDLARMSAEMLKYLDVYSRFHSYSVFNIWSIMMAYPGASQVAGFHRWKSLGRFVRKGQKGIPILAPILVNEDPDDPDSDKILRGFKIVYVYDISQTDGEPLPEPPNWKSPEKNRELDEKLIQFANKRGIQVSFVKQHSEVQGVSKGGLIEVDPGSGTKTLVHEIAHEMMHRDENRPTESCLRELEAESVAFVVCKHFGLDISSSHNYIALHGANSEMIMDHLERIRRTSIEIINEIKEFRRTIV